LFWSVGFRAFFSNHFLNLYRLAVKILGLFFILAKQERGLFYTALRCAIFHSATGGTGGFFRADFSTVDFLISLVFRSVLSAWFVQLVGLLNLTFSARSLVFWSLLVASGY